MAMAARPHVLMLRSPRTPDPYREIFESRGYRVDVVPVLRFTRIHEAELMNVLGHSADFAGIITTSPRAVEALRGRGDRLTEWIDKLFYAVGPETARRARSLGFSPRGADAGSAEDLAAQIIDDRPRAPLLFLSGSRRRDTLPDRLTAGGVSFEELVVYETHTRNTVAWTKGANDVPDWVVFFSPSGIEAARADDTLVWDRVRVAAIGPTTAGALREEGWSVAAVAEEPTPEALYRAIQDAS